MPTNLPHSMASIDLRFNKITLVGHPENYNYCHNCSLFLLVGNPLICNVDLVHMINWFIRDRNGSRPLISMFGTPWAFGSGLCQLDNSECGYSYY